MWRLPDAEGIYTLTCTASTVRGSVSKDYEVWSEAMTMTKLLHCFISLLMIVYKIRFRVWWQPNTAELLRYLRMTLPTIR